MPVLHNQILFEHPLNERTRTLLRISHLFEQFEFHLAGSSQWQSRAALQALLDISSILARADIKKDMLKQLEQQQKSLTSISSNPKVDQVRLHQVLDDIANMIDRLYSSGRQLGGALRKNDFLKSISQRAPIPGGSYEFDLPQFHYWLNLPHTERAMQLDDWRHEISTVQETTELLLGLLRSGSVFQQQTPLRHPFSGKQSGRTPRTIGTGRSFSAENLCTLTTSPRTVLPPWLPAPPATSR